MDIFVLFVIGSICLFFVMMLFIFSSLRRLEHDLDVLRLHNANQWKALNGQKNEIIQLRKMITQSIEE